MTTEERRRRRFSETFRKEQVRLIESGAVSISEVSRLYEVKWDSVSRWVKKYGSKGVPGMLLIQSPKEIDRLRDLEKEVKNLKQIIGDQQVEILYKSKLLAKAKEFLGEDFEKKC